MRVMMGCETQSTAHCRIRNHTTQDDNALTHHTLTPICVDTLSEKRVSQGGRAPRPAQAQAAAAVLIYKPKQNFHEKIQVS